VAPRSCFQYSAILIAAGIASGCSSEAVSPNDDLKNPSSETALLTTATTGAVCQTITFNAFSHGAQVNSVSLSGMTINFAVESFLRPNGSTNPRNILRAWDTNVDPNKGDGVYTPGTDWEDRDLLYKNSGYCEGCEGLGKILIIEDERGFNPWGDYRWGGLITLTGFAENSWIERFTVVDNNVGEPAVVLLVDGVQVGASTPQGEGLVEVVNTTSQPIIDETATFRFGTSAVDNVTGSAGIDNIKVCTRQEELGAEGCTPGYWKNHPASWAATGYSPTQTLESVFDVPNSYGLDNVTLLAALSLSGGPTVANAAGILLHHAVAALLNAAHPGVDYPRTAASIISDVNAALATGSRTTIIALKNALDRDNNRGCPIN
jgi:hypothetical protein